MDHYYLAKITDKKWAEKYQEGQIFMKALQCFGDLSKRDASSQNTFRGDSLEGFSESFQNNHNPHAWIESPLGDREIVERQVGLIDISISIPIDEFISDRINQIGLMPPNVVMPIDPPRKPYPTFYKLVASLI